MQERKRRSDFGTIQTTERDLWLLAWIADQYAVSIDQLTQLVEVYNQATGYGKAAEPVGEHGIRYLVDRWRKAGWVQRQKLLTTMPPWVWLTQKGLRDMGLPFDYLKPGPGRLNHIYHTNAVRLYVERIRAGEAEWVSDRIVNRQRQAGEKRHRVDGEVILEGKRIAIEVELSQKSKSRLASILRELKRDYDTVWYFVNDSCQTAVETAIAAVPGHEDTFLIYHLTTVI